MLRPFWVRICPCQLFRAPLCQRARGQHNTFSSKTIDVFANPLPRHQLLQPFVEWRGDGCSMLVLWQAFAAPLALPREYEPTVHANLQPDHASLGQTHNIENTTTFRSNWQKKKRSRNHTGFDNVDGPPSIIRLFPAINSFLCNHALPRVDRLVLVTCNVQDGRISSHQSKKNLPGTREKHI